MYGGGWECANEHVVFRIKVATISRALITNNLFTREERRMVVKRRRKKLEEASTIPCLVIAKGEFARNSPKIAAKFGRRREGGHRGFLP